MSYATHLFVTGLCVLTLGCTAAAGSGQEQRPAHFGMAGNVIIISGDGADAGEPYAETGTGNRLQLVQDAPAIAWSLPVNAAGNGSLSSRIETTAALDSGPVADQQTGNSAKAIQTGWGNVFRLEQQGTGNSSMLVQIGTDNKASLFQAGSGNQAVQVQRGPGMISVVEQRGSNNTASVFQQ
ncbi:hypothetical protein GCM10007989_12660 [Devosia pacifica]|uniref:Curlin associated repeat-containing protein n=1 Tax=Devosia pacifica TaxID=1335967 RepID=A0A918VRV8_9HYPH|nr:hypothetical protein [Devosia pacifica]GHA18802.1 hypothetical protein GCM10007989_12660 [Devosia pacifica]